MNFEQMKAVYEMVKAIYNKEERLVIGKEKLHLTHGINKNSFADFYRAFRSPQSYYLNALLKYT